MITPNFKIIIELVCKNVKLFDNQIYNENKLPDLKIYIWNLTHGGGYKRPDNEYRIQPKIDRKNKENNKFHVEKDCELLILGWWQEGGVFAGYDYKKHSGIIGWSASIQIKREALEKASVNGFSASDKGNGEIAIAFRPDFFVDYVKNLQELHSFGESIEDLNALDRISEELDTAVNDEIIQSISQPRRTVAQTIRRKVREKRFERNVKFAYGYRCAFCDIQLKLIDAAHIIPVKQDYSTDETSNGIALCVLHHRAYDTSLVTFDENYRIILNQQKIKYFKTVEQDGEADRFIKNLRNEINIPRGKSDRPHTDYVKQANRLRGWKL